GLLHHLAALLPDANLALDLEIDGLLEEAEGVEVLDLDPRAESCLAPLANRDVGIAAQRALLEVAVVDADVDEDAAQVLEVLDRFVRAANVGCAHDLHERHAGAVEIHARGAALGIVEVLARVLLQVGADDADLLLALGCVDDEVAVFTERQLVLRDLIALGQVGIEVVLAREDAVLADGAVQR